MNVEGIEDIVGTRSDNAGIEVGAGVINGGDTVWIVTSAAINIGNSSNTAAIDFILTGIR